MMPFRPALACVLPLILAACSGSGGGGGIGLLRDTDGDGLPDALERQLGSDPRDPDRPYLEGADDDDTPEGPGGDGIPDGLERYLRSGGSPAPILASTDRDRDGVPDVLEVRSGLDPSDPNDPAPGGAGDLETPSGPALDGVPDGLESYLLRRGARSPLTPSTDTDGDGIPDVWEARSGSNPFDALDPAYGRALDLDHDQVPDWIELRDGSDLLLADFPTFDGADDDDGGVLGPDGDGVTDGLEGWLVRKGARAPVTTATDTDGDGLPDVAEVRAGTDPFDPASPLAGGAEDHDGNGVADGLDRILRAKGVRAPTDRTDTDRDGIADTVEVYSGSNPFEPLDPPLFSHFDLDGDGIEDFLELASGSERLDPDSPLPDGDLDRNDATGPPRDLLTDALEELLIARGAAAPVTSYTDSDGDGLPDFVELRWISDPLDPDSPFPGGDRDEDDGTGPSGDGLTDGAEQALIALGAFGPVDPAQNSDTDVIPDAIELVTGTDWLDGGSPRPNRSADIDGDGAVDYLELVLGFDPSSADDPVPDGARDTDGDGLSDALEEILRLTSTPVPVSPTSDSDGDGLYDYLEIQLASDRHDPDSPVRNGGADVDDRSGPPGDGLSDALEHYLVRSGAQRPVTSRSDSDGDEIPDYLEIRLAVDPFDPSSPVADGRADDDGDGVSNALEFVIVALGGIPPVDGRTDSDGDGAPDHLELFAGADPQDPFDPSPSGGVDSDGDGLSDALEIVLESLGATPPLGATSDTDGDGIPDLYEVRSGTHPVRGDHPLVDGALDQRNDTGPRDSITDGLEALLIAQGALAPVTHLTDSDADGAPDHLEVFAGAAPFDGDDPAVNGAADSDGDHMTDALEACLAALGATPPVDPRSDTDGDGAPDYFEVQTAAHPVDADVPVLDGAGSGFDSNDDTGPAGDRISDAFELLLVRIGCIAPVVPAGDTDGDGIPDYFEARSGTNPLDGDSPLAGGGTDSDDTTGPSGDFISDALEAYLLSQGATGPVTQSTDTDGDGTPDFFEILRGSDPFDAGDTIPPGTPPVALDLAIAGIPLEGRVVTGSYRYADAESEPEGATTVRWLRDGVAIPGANTASYRLGTEDLGTRLEFEVVPASAYAFPFETRVGPPVLVGRTIPVPDFPRGAGGPGGVGVADGAGNVRLWLRADTGVEVDGGRVDRWRDVSGYRRDAVPVSVNRRPEPVTGVGPLAAPAVRFSGGQHLTVPRPVEDTFNLLAVFVTNSIASNGSWWLSPAILGGETAPPCNMDYHLGINAGKPLFVVQDVQLQTGTTFSNGSPHLIQAQRVMSSGVMRLLVDGRSRGSATAAMDSLTCPIELFLGSSTLSDGFWTGDLLEVCAFDGGLSVVARNLIENDFGARLGTVPNVPLYPFAATHGGDVAGIGRESSSDVIDSSEGRGILRVSNPTDLSDGDYLFWGTDLPTDFSLTDDVPPPYPSRLRRTWTYAVTDGGAGNGVGRVDLRFRLQGLFLSQSAEDYALLFDDDPVFADARVVTGPAEYDPELETIEFKDVPLGPEPFFTLAVKAL